ncbi:zinc-binding dehydrogenase [Alphaproteobacteria bacterium]|nr:zinc-binding dehydrogenase [Alphaproteobacteria bacterium]
MKAVMVTDDGVKFLDTPTPKPKANEVLIQVRACGLNRADLMVASGMAHGAVGGAGTIVGMEISGEVAELGVNVQGFAVGDRVMASGGAAWAEYAVADWGRTVKIPDNNMSFDTAATLPVALQTMHDAVVTNGALTPGKTIMIQGASSGVGIMGMQIAKLKGASLVVGSSTNAGRRARLSEFGADLAVDPRDPSWVSQVLEATDGKGVDTIVDQVSGYVANQNLAATAIKGRIVNVGRLGGFSGDFNFDLHAARRINYIGVTFRTRTIDEIREIVRLTWADLGNAVISGELSLPMDKTYPIQDVTQALARMKANEHFGKITLSVG